jgi:hypothetical protein
MSLVQEFKSDRDPRVRESAKRAEELFVYWGAAAASDPAATGGIDLTDVRVDLQENADSGTIKFHLDPAIIEQLNNAAGFYPVIIKVQQVTDLGVFLGL